MLINYMENKCIFRVHNANTFISNLFVLKKKKTKIIIHFATKQTKNESYECL